MYKSKDSEYMGELSKKINQLNHNHNVDHDRNVSSWEFIKRNTVLEDLHTYLVSNLQYAPVYVPNNNIVNPKFMFITATESEQELSILDAIVSKLGVSDYYRTSYFRSTTIKDFNKNEHLTTTLKSQINIVNPEIVIFFGLNIADWTLVINERHKELSINNKNVMVTSSLLDLLSNALDDKQKNTLKHYIWNDLVKYN